MSNRGIKIFRVPGDYNTLGEVTSNGHPQFRDIVIVRPTSYNDKMHIYQYLYDVNEALYLKEIKDYQWEDLSNDINVTFTDNVIIPNVTPIRKAHQEDYRNMLMFLKNVSANKYGDFYEGLFDQTLAKHQWNNGTYASEMFLSADNNTFYFNISEETLLNISKIDTDFNVISPLFILGAENLEVYVDTQINAELDVIGETTLHSDVHLNSEGGSTLIEGETRINNNLIVAGDESLGGSLTVGGDLSVDGSTSLGDDVNIDGNLNVQKDTGIQGELYVEQDIRSNSSIIATNIIKGSSLDVGTSEHSNVITNLNADLLDGKHYTDIVSKIPKFEMGTDTLLDSGDDEIGTALKLIFEGQTAFIPAWTEACGCVCTCTCTCTCVCLGNCHGKCMKW